MKQNNVLYGYIIPAFIAIILLVLIGISTVSLLYRVPVYTTDIIADDIVLLKNVLENIDKECKIIDFDYAHNLINFLNIKKNGFVGSEVGTVNLTYPKKWSGPYLKDNPTIQEKEYMVVRTKYGYFITPGEGVRLPNGKIIGKDIILNENADIESMMRDKNALMYEGKSLAAPLIVGKKNRKQIQTILPID